MGDKKKIIIAIILFIFLGLAVFSFAQTPEDEGSGSRSNSGDNGSSVVTTTKAPDDSNEDSDTRETTTARRETTSVATTTEGSQTDNETVTPSTEGSQTDNETVAPSTEDNNQSSSDDNDLGVGDSNVDKTIPAIVINGEPLEDDVEEVAFATINDFYVVDDNNDTVIKVNDKEVEIDELLAILNEDGEYLIEVSDGVNTRTLKLTVLDTTAPTFKFENTSGSVVASRTVKLIASEAIQAPEGWTEVEGSNGKEWTKTFTSNTKIKDFTVTDLAGNVSDVQTLDVKNTDSSVPTGTVTYSTDKSTNGDVTVTLTTTTDCETPEGWTKVNWRKFTKVYSENVSETVHLTSRTGIEGDRDILVEISNIDKVPATLSYSIHGNQVRIKADEKVTLNVKGWTNKNAGKEWRKTLAAGKNYEITATDEAGNTTTIVIDRILPTLTYHVYGSQVRIKADEKVTLDAKGWTDYKKDGTEWRKTLAAGKNYEITATDEVGNTSTIVINLKKDSKIVLTEPENKEYDGTVKEVLATLIKGEIAESIEVTYYNGDEKLDGAPINAGTYTAVAEFAGDDEYYKSTASLEFTIEKAQVTMSVVYPEEGMSYTGNEKKLSFVFTNSNGDEVEGIQARYEVLNSDFNGYVDLVNPANYFIKVYVTPETSDNYELTYDSWLFVEITKGTTSIELEAPKSLVWDGNAKAYTVKESEISNEVTLTYYEVTEEGENKLTSAPTNIGNYKVVAEFAGNDYYNATSVSEEFAITKLTVTAYLDVPENMEYDGQVKDVKVIFKDQDGNIVTGIKYDLMARYTVDGKTTLTQEVKEVGSYEIIVWIDSEMVANIETTNPGANIGVVEVTEAIAKDVYSHVLVPLDKNYISYEEIKTDDRTTGVYTYNYDGTAKGFILNLYHNGNDVTNEADILMLYQPVNGNLLFNAPSESGTYDIYPIGIPNEYNSEFYARVVILPADNNQ